ncbi:uncharacterized protein LOC125253136 [Scomber scombrus]|uniref:Uncharacterized protein LOC125253136 n=1 Tax=Scomber scombrus TaxID=13677 RepID=A0AAV1QHY1_SCOSC
MAQSKNKSFCCVPQCSNSKQKQPYLHFHDFPKNQDVMAKWVTAIRRDEGIYFVIRKGSTLVCSQHFTAADYNDGSARLKAGAVPSRFSWNYFQTFRRKPSVYERGTAVRQDEHRDAGEHDYATYPPPGALDEALDYIAELEARLQVMSVGPQTIQSRFCFSDQTMRYYTRFPSQEVFRVFWESICPSTQYIVYWTRAQKIGQEAFPTPSPNRKIHVIDEFFMYCCRVVVGLKEQVIADIFQTSTSTVSRVIITWANYLFLVLGSLPIWMSRQQVELSMPAKYKLHNPKLRVILDCTEVRCESPASLTLHSETFSNYKSTQTFKGLLGISPCGAVTFISPLYTASISDKELTKRSGILNLLESGDEVMADKGFNIDELLSSVGASPFKRKARFSEVDCDQTQDVAQLRILVETVLRRVKENHIWDSVVPLSLSGSINLIWHNCCSMVNYQGPMILEE